MRKEPELWKVLLREWCTCLMHMRCVYRLDCGALGLGSQRLRFSRTRSKLVHFMAIDFVQTFLACGPQLPTGLSFLAWKWKWIPWDRIFRISANSKHGSKGNLEPSWCILMIQPSMYPEMEDVCGGGRSRGKKRLETSPRKYLCLKMSSWVGWSSQSPTYNAFLKYSIFFPVT